MPKFYKLIVIIAVILLMVLVWFAGPVVGLVESEHRLIGIILILAVAICSILIKQWKSAKAAKAIESEMSHQIDMQIDSTRPDRKEEVRELKEKLNSSIALLKSSRLGGGFKSSTALYALPWYMFIGPSASGKTTAIKNSGLNFPKSLEDKVQGVGGTRNCDWWFSADAILLDTAGRYMSDEDDLEEWYAFLKFLKKNRKHSPIDGAIVAVSIPDIISADDDGLEKMASQIRSRIDELISKLGIRFPVYLMFTKVDLLTGFVEFFSDMGKGERTQVWGATFKSSHGPNYSSKRFCDEFDNLYISLSDIRRSRVVSIKNQRNLESAFNFPMQFKALRKKLITFTDHLFTENPYTDNPIFRGFYFTSGTQEGTPIDQAITQIGLAAGLPNNMGGSFTASIERKSYFIKNLFNDIIFQDRYLVEPSGKAIKERGLSGKAVYAASIIGIVVFSIVSTFSYVNKKRTLLTAYEATALMLSSKEENFDKKIKELAEVRAEIIKLDDSFGSHIGSMIGHLQVGDLEQIVVRAYLNNFKTVLLLPTAIKMENKMQILADLNPLPKAEAITLLNAYSMLGEPAIRDDKFLSDYLNQLWTGILDKNADASGLIQIISEQFEFYLAQNSDDGTPLIENKDSVVSQLKAALQSIPEADIIYASIKQKANLKPVGLNSLLRGKRNDIISTRLKINGIFTVEGYKAYMKKALNDLAERPVENIVGLSVDKNNEKEQNHQLLLSVRELYFQDLIKEWKGFIKSIEVKKSSSLSSSVEMLDQLSSKDSPVNLLFVRITKEMTALVNELNPSLVSSDILGIIGKLKKKIVGKKLKITNSPTVGQEILSAFSDYFIMVGKSESDMKSAFLEQYRQSITLLFEKSSSLLESPSIDDDIESYAAEVLNKPDGTDINNSWKLIRRGLKEFDSDNRKSVRLLFETPVRNLWLALLIRTQAGLNRKWKSEVAEWYGSSLKNKYPFNRNGDDASLIDVSQFFMPDKGVFRSFYNNSLAPFIIEKNNKIESKTWLHRGLRISGKFKNTFTKCNKLGEILFGKSDRPNMTFELYPRPVSGVTETLISIDGQDIRYRNQQQEWYGVKWPVSSQPGAKLQVTGRMRHKIIHKGEWGFFRLLNDAVIISEGSNKFKAIWSFDLNNGKQLEVSYLIRANSFKNPFAALDKMFKITIPKTIG